MHTPLHPTFYTSSKTWVYMGIHYFLIFALKHGLWVLVSEAVLTFTHNLCFEQKYENSKKKISPENSDFYSREKSLYVALACLRNVLFVFFAISVQLQVHYKE